VLFSLGPVLPAIPALLSLNFDSNSGQHHLIVTIYRHFLGIGKKSKSEGVDANMASLS